MLEITSLSDPMRNDYDEVQYPGFVLPQSHPDRLATLGILFGMRPAAVEKCRVLELGCGDAVNIIPMAMNMPDSDFVGVDLAARPIAKGQSMADALKLQNIVLQQCDVMDLSRELGEFHYIIAHGLYSWVPAPVQEKILAICEDNLAPNGIAYVSYNTYPGGHLRQMVGEMLQFHVRHISEPTERLAEARAFLESLTHLKADSAEGVKLLKEQLEQAGKHSDAILFHDDLAENAVPTYFCDFMEDAARHGLQYLAEAEFSEMQDVGLLPNVRRNVDAVQDNSVIANEQYADFFKCRTFRRTLLCHDDVRVDRRLEPRRIEDLYVTSSARPVSHRPDIHSPAVEEFRSPTGRKLLLDKPLAKAVMLCLSEAWPKSVPFGELLARGRQHLAQNVSSDGIEAAQLSSMFGNLLLEGYAGKVVDLHVYEPPIVTEVSSRPIASPLARLQMRTEAFATSLRHTSVKIEDRLVRNLLLLLDGTRDRRALINDLASSVESQDAALQNDGRDVTEPGEIRRILADRLEPILQNLAGLALLVG